MQNFPKVTTYFRRRMLGCSCLENRTCMLYRNQIIETNLAVRQSAVVTRVAAALHAAGKERLVGGIALALPWLGLVPAHRTGDAALGLPALGTHWQHPVCTASSRVRLAVHHALAVLLLNGGLGLAGLFCVAYV